MSIADQTTHDIGTFMCATGGLRVSDPCYDAGAWCAGVVANCRKGTWRAVVRRKDYGDWGCRTSCLVVTHEDDGVGPEEEAGFEVGVDSGQAGVFDMMHYTDASYDSWCRITLTGIRAGTQRYGAVSSSGFGDGGYSATIRRDSEGQCFYIRIDFITEEDVSWT